MEYLLEEDIEIGYKELVTVEEDQEERDFNNEDRVKYQSWKVKFAQHIIQGVKLGQQAQQTWLIFNGGIELWNSYLPLYKKHNFFELILTEGVPAMIECFEAMNNCFINASFSADNVDYELDKKMQVFSNISMMLARIYEQLGKKRRDGTRVRHPAAEAAALPPQENLRLNQGKSHQGQCPILEQLVGKGGAPAKGAKDVAQVVAYQPTKAEIITS